MIAERLKKSILQAAIQGKLTEQLPEDGNAKDLLKKIQIEKEKLIKEGKINKEKPLPKITEDEIPFEIPENWSWVRLGEIGEIIGGGTPKTEDTLSWLNGDIPWITPADMRNVIGKYVSQGKRNITAHGLRHSSARLMPKGTVLFSSRAPIGHLAIADNEITTNQGFKSIVLYKSKMNEFIYYALMKSVPEIEKMGSGTTFKEVSGALMKTVIIPLPPLDEQIRIVERIEELLAEIEVLKKDEIKLEELQNAFPKKIKDAILQYAIQGKLTKHLPEDGNAKDLLKEIQTEKEKLIKEGKINKEKPLPKITENEIPFDIPENWCWVRFGNLVNFRIGKTPQRNNGRFWGQDYHWVSIADMKPDGLISETKEKISGIALNEVFKKALVPAGTLLMSFKLTIGRVSILDINAVHNEAIISIFPYKNEENIARNYYSKILPLISTTGDFKTAIKGKTLNSTSINNLLIPLPPLAEQKRIVKRIEELLPLCEELQ